MITRHDGTTRTHRPHAHTAKGHGWALNCAIGAQVVLGALTTGVAAATTGRQVSVRSCLSGVDARKLSTHAPPPFPVFPFPQTSIATSILGGLSTLAASYLAKARGSNEPDASARRGQELDSFIRDCEAFKLDHGHKVGPDHDDMIMRYRRRFEEIMGNEFEGVGDDVKVNKKEREKSDSPA